MGKVFVAAFVLGLIFNAAPGAVFAETIRRGLREGFRGGLAVQIGSLAGDALWAILGLAGVGLLLRIEVVRVPVGIAGALYLMWLAWDAWRAARREIGADARAAATPARGRALRSGLLLSITNPQNVAYWAAVGSALGAIGVDRPAARDYAIYFAGFMAASVAWAFICAALVDWMFRRAGPTWVRLTYRACAIAFLALALSTLRDVWRYLHEHERDDDAHRGLSLREGPLPGEHRPREAGHQLQLLHVWPQRDAAVFRSR